MAKIMLFLQISRIQLNSCPDVVLSLDLESVEPGVQTLEIKNSQNVKIESIKFDPKFENQQRLRMMFSNVVRAVLSNLEVTETLQVINRIINLFSGLANFLMQNCLQILKIIFRIFWVLIKNNRFNLGEIQWPNFYQVNKLF